jgi:6-phosphogluconolactonase
MAADRMTAGTLSVSADAGAMAHAAAEWFTGTLNARAGALRVALTGGSTPKGFYKLLGSASFRERVPWDRIDFYFGDERFVPHDHPDSNYRMVRETLTAPIAPSRMHPIPADGTPQSAADRYEAELKQAYGGDALDPARPLFDIVLLGLGGDGHTASLLPGQPVLAERTRWVAAVPHGRPEPRITLTYSALESSRAIAFLVAGAEKANALSRARAGDPALPAGRLAPLGTVMWFADAAAAGVR